PVQVLPRRVAQIAQPVRNVALSDAAIAVLLTGNTVLCFAGERSFKNKLPNCELSARAHVISASSSTEQFCHCQGRLLRECVRSAFIK
ncbi:hypothetical protein DFH11DRAFT_1595339, partial [Phellopilus nigrolimitatus]